MTLKTIIESSCNLSRKLYCHGYLAISSETYEFQGKPLVFLDSLFLQEFENTKFAKFYLHFVGGPPHHLLTQPNFHEGSPLLLFWWQTHFWTLTTPWVHFWAPFSHTGSNYKKGFLENIKHDFGKIRNQVFNNWTNNIYICEVRHSITINFTSFALELIKLWILEIFWFLLSWNDLNTIYMILNIMK